MLTSVGIHSYMCIHISTCTYTQTHIHTYVHANVRTHTHTHTHKHTHTDLVNNFYIHTTQYTDRYRCILVSKIVKFQYTY